MSALLLSLHERMHEPTFEPTFEPMHERMQEGGVDGFGRRAGQPPLSAR
ncbi:hypothetical protein ACH4FX_31400 [Streptomyces sp. NPDC018019]